MSRKKSEKTELSFDLLVFTNNLKELQKQKNLNNAQLEREMGLTRGMWKTYIEGNSIPSIDAANKISQYAGKSLNEFLGMEEEKPGPALIQEEKPPYSLDVIGKILNEINDLKTKMEVLWNEREGQLKDQKGGNPSVT